MKSNSSESSLPSSSASLSSSHLVVVGYKHPGAGLQLNHEALDPNDSP